MVQYAPNPRPTAAFRAGSVSGQGFGSGRPPPGGVQSFRGVMSSGFPFGRQPSPMSGDAVPAEDDLRHVAGELLPEERRGEVHLVGRHADDAEPVEEAPALRAVRRDEAAAGRLVIEDAARVGVDVREHEAHVVLGQRGERAALDEDPAHLPVDALDVRLLARAVGVRVEDARAVLGRVRDLRPVQPGVAAARREKRIALDVRGVRELRAVVGDDNAEELPEERGPRGLPEGVEHGAAVPGCLAAAYEPQGEAGVVEYEREHVAPVRLLPLQPVHLGLVPARVRVGDPVRHEVGVRPPHAAPRVRLGLRARRARLSRARERQVAAHGVEHPQPDVVVHRPLADREDVRVVRHDVPDRLAPAGTFGEHRVDRRELPVRGAHALARAVQDAGVVPLRDLGDVVLLAERARALALAPVADERRRLEPPAPARQEVRARLEAAVAVAAELPHAARHRARVPARAAVETGAQGVRRPHPLVAVDAPILHLARDRGLRPPDLPGDLGDRPPSAQARLDRLPVLFRHVFRHDVFPFCFSVPPRPRASGRPGCPRAGDGRMGNIIRAAARSRGEFAKLNANPPLGEGISSPSPQLPLESIFPCFCRDKRSSDLRLPFQTAFAITQ